MNEFNQKNNPYLIDSALDCLVEHGHYKVMEEEKHLSLKEKYSKYVCFYVNRNLGRGIDYLSGEQSSLNEEIEKYWPVFMATKDGVQQRLKTE